MLTKFSKFPESSKKYWKMTGDLNQPFWNNINLKNPKNTIKYQEKNRKPLKLFSLIGALFEPYWSFKVIRYSAKPQPSAMGVGELVVEALEGGFMHNLREPQACDACWTCKPVGIPLGTLEKNR